MEESVSNAADQEQDLLLAKRSLESRLEEAQRHLQKLTLEHQDLSASYQEEVKQKEVLKRAKNDLEEEKRLLDRSIAKLTKEVGHRAGRCSKSAPLSFFLTWQTRNPGWLSEVNSPRKATLSGQVKASIPLCPVLLGGLSRPAGLLPPRGSQKDRVKSQASSPAKLGFLLSVSS